MPVDYIASNATDGLALKLYRGEDMVLLAFDIDESLKKPDFVGFGIQYFVGNATQPRDVFNFLTFKRVRLAAKAAKKEIALTERTSMRSPIQMFRWAHVPSVPLDGPVPTRCRRCSGMATSRPLPGPQRARRSVPIVPRVGHFSISASREASPARRPTSATFQTSAR